MATQRDKREGGEKKRRVNIKVPVLKDRLRERRCPGATQLSVTGDPEKKMLVVDLGVTCVSMGVTSVPGSAVHLVLCMLRRARQVLAKSVIQPNKVAGACHRKSDEQKLGVVSQGRLPGGKRGWVWG